LKLANERCPTKSDIDSPKQ
jgi:hypothetical protein